MAVLASRRAGTGPRMSADVKLFDYSNSTLTKSNTIRHHVIYS